MTDDFRKLRAALLRLVAAVQREMLAPLYRKLRAKRTADRLLEMAHRLEIEADELDRTETPDR